MRGATDADAGGSGFVERYLVKCLVDMGDEVFFLSY